MKRALAFGFTLLFSFFGAQAQTTLESTVPGDALNWETNGLTVVLSVLQEAEVTLEIYSPGFDPEDYRAPDELGDERYDRGQGELGASFVLTAEDGSELIAQDFGIEPHRDVTLFEGRLAAGEYTLRSTFTGLGKNTFIYTVNSNPAGAVRLFVEDGETQLYNVERGDFQEVFTLTIPEEEVPTVIEIYDGDGEAELLARMTKPDGSTEDIPVSEDLEWIDLRLEQAGTYSFDFVVPDSAYQYTNTIGVRVDKRFIVDEDEDVPLTVITAAPSFIIDKTVAHDVVEVGEQVDFSITVSNAGGAIGRARLQDVLPDGLEGEDLDRNIIVPAGATRSYRLSATVSEDAPDVIVNTATLSNDSVSLEAEATVTVVRPEPALPASFEVTKTADPEVVRVGDTVTYTVTVTNTGERAGRVALADILPRGIDTRFATRSLELAPGESQRFEITGTVAQGAPDLLINHAVISTIETTQRARADVTVQRDPPRLALSKRALPDRLRVGDYLRYLIQVRNLGESAAEVRLEDVLPDGLEGEAIDATFTLQGGEVRTFAVNARVLESAADIITNSAALTSESGTITAVAFVRVIRDAPPAFELTKTADLRKAQAGDLITFTVEAANTGGSAAEVTLSDTLPAGLGGDDLEETFVLEPGSSQRFVLTGTVAEDASGLLINRARLESPVGTLQASAIVTVVQPEPEAEAPFEQRRFSRINLYYQVGTVLDCGLGELAPGEPKTIGARFSSSATPEASRFRGMATPAEGLSIERGEISQDEDGSYSYRVRVTNSTDTVLSNVSLIEALPQDVTLLDASYVCGSLAGGAEQVLLTHTPPEGASYDMGSSLLEDEPFSDPLIGTDGRLYWLLPYASEGELSYLVSHEDALPPVEDPTLTLDTGGSELFIVGDVSFNDLPEASAEMTEDVSGPYVQVRPIDAVADARRPLELELRAPTLEDATPYITVASNLEPIEEDAAPLVTGYQVALNDGVGTLRLKPQASPVTLELTLGYGDTITETSVFIPGTRRGLYQYHVAATVSIAGDVAFEGLARGYAEAPLGSGSLQAAVDVGADSLGGFTLDRERGLILELDPTERFPLTGAGEEARPALRSDDGIAVRYDQAAFSVGYYADPLGLPGLESLPRVTALRAELHGDLKVEAYAGLTTAEHVTVEFFGDGTRRYRIGSGVRPGSERLVLVSDAGEAPLERLKDYQINYRRGVITLVEPLMPYDTSFNALKLRVSYTPDDEAREDVTVGGGVSYTSGGFSVGVGAAYLDYLRFGARVSYRAEGLNLSASYRVNLIGGDLEGSEASLKASGRKGNLEADINLTYTERVRGSGRLAYRIFPGGRIVLDHLGTFGRNRSGLLYEQTLFETFYVGLGVGYIWEDALITGLASAGYSDGENRVGVTHAQPFDTEARSETTLGVRLALNENLDFKADASYQWGNALAAVLGLEQFIGAANLSLDYQLPTASGEGNRARFGIDAPLPLGGALDATFGASYSIDFGSDAAFLAVNGGLRYKTDSLVATFDAEVSLPTEGDLNLEVHAGAAGQLAEDQTLAFDADAQVLPDLEGAFSVAYALKGSTFSLLTYHRFETGGTLETTLKGELAPTYYPTSALQLRPSVAYRINFDDGDATLVQGTLFATYLFNLGGGADPDETFIPYSENVYGGFRLGVGGGVNYLWAPGLGESRFGASLEVTAQLLEPLWLALGYTFPEDFGGLTLSTRGGLYVRVDLLGGGQF